MIPFAPFAPYAHSLPVPPLWHHGSHFHTDPPSYESDNDSGYASSDHDNLGPTSTPMHWRLRSTGATRHLHIFEPRPDLHDAFCACDAPLPHLEPRSFYHCSQAQHIQPRPYPDMFEPVGTPRSKDKAHGREIPSDRTPSPSPASTSAHLDSEDHKSPIPAVRPFLGNRVESETDVSSSSFADSLASCTSERKGWKRHLSGDRVSASTRRGVREERRRLEKRVGVLKERERVLRRVERERGKER